MRRERRPSPSRYLRNRALRILPAYWVILLISALVLESVRTPDGTVGALRDPWPLTQSLLFVQNYDPDQVVTGIGPAWSLNVEVVFYVLLPGLAALGYALARHVGGFRAALVPAAVLLVLGLVGKAIAAYAVPPKYAYGGWESDWHSVIERSFLGQADLFAFGMALAVIRVLWEDGRVRLPAWWRLPTLLVSATSLLVICAKATNDGEQMSYSPWNTVVALDFAILLALVVLVHREDPRPRLVGLLETRVLVTVGVASYSLFLWHNPLVQWLQAHGLTLGGTLGFLVNLALIAGLAIAISLATYRLVEAPSLRLRRPIERGGEAYAQTVAVGEVSAAP